MSGRRSQRACALALAALVLGACDGAPPPSAAPPAGAPAGVSAAPPPSPVSSAPAGGAGTTPGPANVPAAAAAFDFGEIKTAAEYTQDPQFAGADLVRGQLLSLACAACHTFAADQKAIIGPNLHAVFGRPAAALADFNYSPALRASTLVWTPRALEAWLADPARFVAGTTMTFTGYRSAADRRDLIAYLLHATQ